MRNFQKTQDEKRSVVILQQVGITIGFRPVRARVEIS
jgi:hypothetical protein